MIAKRLSILSVVVLFAVSIIAIFSSIAGAHNFKTGDNVTVAASETIDNTLFTAGKTIDIAGTINGDVFCAGQNVTVSATVNGDVICAGQTVRVSGEVSGDIRIAAQTINVNGVVEGNATIAGQTFTLESDSSIAGDVTLGATDAVINGSIGRDVAVGGADIILNSSIGRNIKGNIESIKLNSEASVGGFIEYESFNEITLAEGAEVSGDITRITPAEQDTSFAFAWGWFLYVLIASFFAVTVLVLLFPGVYRDVTNQAKNSLWKSILIGAVASFVVPVFLVLLLFTFVGIPLAIVLGLLWVVVASLSGSFTSFFVGRKLLQDSKNAVAIMLGGTAVMTILYFIPVIGFFAVILSSWFGIGMLTQELMRRTPKPNYAPEKPVKSAKKSKK